MKTLPLLFGIALIAFSPGALAESHTNGFLIIEVGRFAYAQGNREESRVKQTFKIPLNSQFISQFQGTLNSNRMGTGFWCNGGNLKSSEGSTRFTCWIWKTKDNRWAINIWGQGTETIQGIKVDSRNPNVSQWVVFKRWEDLETSYQVSYVRNYDGINVTFTARYAKENEVDSRSDTPTIPVKKTDQSEVFKGDDLSRLPVELKGGFEEG